MRRSEEIRQTVEDVLDEFLLTASPESTLRSLIRELSFWEGSPSQVEYHRPAKRKVKQLAGVDSSDATITTARTTKAESETSRDMNYLTTCRRGKSGQGSTISSPKPVWKAALDPATGRTYYYDALTRRTQWEKPAEIRAAEKRKRAERRKRDREFFREMERNLLASLNRGEIIPGIPAASVGRTGPPQDIPPDSHAGVRPSRVRTLSGMDGDDRLLAELRIDSSIPHHHGAHTKSSHTKTAALAAPKTKKLTSNATNNRAVGKPPLPQYQQVQHQHSTQLKKSLDTMELSPDVGEISIRSDSSITRLDSNDSLAGEKFLDGPIHDITVSQSVTTTTNNDAPSANPPGHIRRNTGGTIYVKSTMTNPDVRATIKCVCGVYRAHVVQSAQRRNSHSPTSIMTHPIDLEIFLDSFSNNGQRKRSSKRTNRTKDSSSSLPSLNEIMAFYQEFYNRSQMEHDTIIMSLIYVERLIKETNGAMTPMIENWRSVLFACMVLASKVWDDLSMWNIDFSNVSASSTEGLSAFTLKRINQLELGLLKLLKFDVKVPASEYAKYYFLIRTMLLRSGCLSETDMKPIGKEDARRLENKTCRYQDSRLKDRGSRRTRSLDDWSWLSADHCDADSPVLKDQMCLEQLVSMKG